LPSVTFPLTKAAAEMMRRTGQMGVPVIADEQEAIVGFDMARLQRMAAHHRSGPGLGVRLKDAPGGSGAYVGSVRPGSPAEQAGIQPCDIVHEMSGRPIRNADDLERVARQRRPGQPMSTDVERAHEPRTVILPA